MVAGLPAKTNELAELLDCDPEEAQSILDHTVGHFTDGDAIHWDSIRDQYRASSDFAKRCANNGAKGGRAPRGSDRLPNANQSLSQPVTINQEPSTITQEPECVSTVERPSRSKLPSGFANDDLPVLREGIPLELQHDRWCWQSQPRGNGLAKIPVRRNKQFASVTNRDHWSDFESVWDTYQSGGFSGLGFCLAGDGLVFVDYDSADDRLESSDPRF